MTDVRVVIPYLSMPWCLEDCIESFGDTGYPVYIVDNSEDQWATENSLNWPSNVSVFPQGRNIGIAAAWNIGLEQGGEQTILCSQTVRLAPAELNRRTGDWGLDYVAAGVEKHANEYGCTFSDQGFHFMSIGRALIDLIGYPDPNFNYGEDDDYRHRMVLAGDVTMGAFNESGVFSIGYGLQKRSGTVPPDWHRVKSWWTHKWNSPQSGIIGYRTPFGNPDNPLSYWPEVR